MKKNITTLQTGIKWGGYLGIALVFFDLLLYLAGYKSPSETNALQFLVYPIMFALIYLAVNDYKNENERFLSLGEAISTAIYTGLVAAAISIVYSFIFIYVIDTGFMEEVKAVSKEAAMSKGNMSEEDYEKIEGLMNFFVSPYFLMIITLIIYTITALISGLIAGLILRTKEAN